MTGSHVQIGPDVEAFLSCPAPNSSCSGIPPWSSCPLGCPWSWSTHGSGSGVGGQAAALCRQTLGFTPSAQGVSLGQMLGDTSLA